MSSIISDETTMKRLGQAIGDRLKGGECIELIGDVGAGKTTLMKGLAKGMGVDEEVQSPSFTISREYEARDGMRLCHYDFYRLPEPGLMSYELAESLSEDGAVIAIEWSDTVKDVLPEERVVIRLSYGEEDDERQVNITYPSRYDYLEEAIREVIG